jgi:signal transduction histidine kinase
MASAALDSPLRAEPLAPALALRLLAQMSRVRIILVFVLLNGLMAAPPGTILSPPAAYGGLSVAAVLAIASYFVFDWRREFVQGRLNLAAAFFVIGDLFALSFFIYGMGAAYAYFFPLLLCEVIFAAFFFHRLEVMFVTGMACCSVVLAASAQGLTPMLASQVGIAMTAFIVVAWLAYGVDAVLQRERVFNQRVIRHLGQPLLLLGSDGRVLLTNPQLDQLAGAKVSHAVGKQLTELVNSSDMGLLPKLLANVGDLLPGESAEGSDIEIENPEPIVLRRTILPCLSSAGVPVGWVIMWHDITELVESVRTYETGLSLLGHELRSPITCLRLLIEILGNVTESDHNERERIIDHLMAETDRLSRLVASVLELSQLDNPDFRLKREKIAPLPMVERVNAMFAARAAEAGVRFTCSCPGALPDIYGNEDRLEQVLINLCENAVNHTPEGGTVALAVRRSPEVLVFEVHDTGLGIPEYLKERIFDKYCSGGTRLSGPGRSRMTGGLGLGLALVKRVVELHDGRVKVDSDPDNGTTFTVMLPLGVPVEEQRMAEAV